LCAAPDVQVAPAELITSEWAERGYEPPDARPGDDARARAEAAARRAALVAARRPATSVGRREREEWVCALDADPWRGAGHARPGPRARTAPHARLGAAPLLGGEAWDGARAQQRAAVEAVRAPGGRYAGPGAVRAVLVAPAPAPEAHEAAALLLAAGRARSRAVRRQMKIVARPADRCAAPPRPAPPRPAPPRPAPPRPGPARPGPARRVWC
jgi:hypothetical protein